MTFPANIGHIWLNSSRFGHMGLQKADFGLNSRGEMSQNLGYLKIGQDDRNIGRNPNMAILWGGRNFYARNFYFQILVNMPQIEPGI